MSDYVVSQTNHATTQDWLNAAKDLKISTHIAGYSLGGKVEIVLCPTGEGTKQYPSQGSSFDWEAGANILLGQYDEAWRRLANL